jgi:uncharacterized membrane protein
MKNYLEKFKQNCISGVLFLLPFLIVLILIKKVFGYFAKFGDGIAKFMGFDQLFGIHAADFFGTLILFLFVFFCGFLVRLAFFKKLSDLLDSKLNELIPGYEKHKETAKKKLIDEKKIQTDKPVLIQFGEYWQPGFLVEQDSENAVVAVPKADEKELYIVPIRNIKFLKETSLSALQASIKESGKGLLACK